MTEHKIAETTAAETGIDLSEFVRIGDQVINFANHNNNDLGSPRGVMLATLYGIARYGAYLTRSVPPADREARIADLADRFAAMMREHYGDPRLMG